MEAIRDRVLVADRNVAVGGRDTLRVRAALEPVLIAGGFFVLVVLMGRWAGVFQYDTDEGLNLMKAMLVARGFHLYNPIWSDQPPVYTLVLAGVFKVFGVSLTAARLTSAGFAALLVGSLYDLLRRRVSKRAALAGALFLIASAWFGRLSYSAMIGLPALALTMLSFALLARWTLRLRWVTLIASALCMSAGIETKLFVLVAIPAAWYFLWLGARPRDDGGSVLRARIVAILVWSIIVLGMCAAVLLAFGATSHQLVDTHSTASELRKRGFAPMALTLMRRDSDLWGLVIVTIVVLIVDYRRNRNRPGARPRRWRWAIVPLVWLALASVVMQFHRPAWYHHSPLLAIPAAWAGAFAIDALYEAREESVRDESAGRTRWFTVLIVAALAWQGVKLYLAGQRFFVQTDREEEQRVVRNMRAYAGQTHWVFTDIMIYPVAVGLPAPPEVAVVSTKRRAAGQLPDSLVANVLDRYQPEQVLLGSRIDFGPEVMDRIAAHYRLVGEFNLDKPARLYLRDTVMATTREMP